MERSRHMDQNRERSLGKRWSDATVSKTVVFWTCVASAVLTMIIGFSWGGWVTGGTARTTAETMAYDAVVKRLAPICVVLSGQDPAKAVKLVALKEGSAWQRGEYVGKQGWATMPGEREPDSRVAQACAELLMPTS
jgi:pimeloyl-ACP methyl ester carboxylesterase